MAFRTGVPRRENQLAGSMGTSATSVMPEFDKFGEVEPYSLAVANRKELNAQYDDQLYDSRKGVVIQRWGAPGEQQFEQAVKVLPGSDDIDAAFWEKYYSTAGTGVPDTTPPVPDSECCAWLRINAPSNVESGSTSGVSAGGKKGCVYYWSIEGCNPSTWGCGALTAAGTGGSGAGLHQTSQGMVFIAPTIPDKDTINCGKTVDTKIKVAVLTADGKKQVAAAVGTAGWSGYGMGPGDELYDLFGPENVCDDTATITTKAGDCLGCSGSEIGFTTQHMPLGSSQGLGVLHGSSTENYTWELSGGGSLSKKTGMSTTYVAPSTNYNCEENAFITLKCNGRVVDSLGIAVYAPDSVTVMARFLDQLTIFYGVCTHWDGGCYGASGMCFTLYRCHEYDLYCDGTILPTVYWNEQTMCTGAECFPCVNPGCRTTAERCYEGLQYSYEWLTHGIYLGCCGDPPTS